MSELVCRADDYLRRKGWSLALSLALNIGLAWCIYSMRWSVPAERESAVIVAEIAGASVGASAPPATPAPAAVAPPRRIVESSEVITPVPAPSPSRALTPAIAPELALAAKLALAALAANGGGERCDLASTLRDVLQANDDVLDAVALTPRSPGSAENAVMVWDGAWISALAATAERDDVIRSAISDLVRAASSECRAMPIVGPRFVILDDASGGTTLVIGSGAWRWGDLLARADS